MRIEVIDLDQGYGDRTVIHGISFEASSGEVLSILGPNGSGKSTLIKTMCNIMDPRSGRILIDGTDASTIPKNEFAKRVAYVPQSTSSFGYNSVYETVIAGRRPYIEWSYSSSDIAIAADSMRRMHVDQLHDSLLSDLSGGQKQRVHIARALAQNSDFFVLDEPTSSLDLKHQLDTMGIMRDLCANRSKGAVIALHDLNLAMNYCDKVVVLSDSEVYDSGPTDRVIDEVMIRDVYGVYADIVTTDHGRFIHPYMSDWDRVPHRSGWSADDGTGVRIHPTPDRLNSQEKLLDISSNHMSEA